MFKHLRYILVIIILALSAGAVYAETEIDLKGTWDYCVINSENDYPPGEGTRWEQVTLPDRSLFEILAKQHNITRGYLLFRKTITLNTLPAEDLLFQAGEIMNADMVFINGIKIGSTGVFPPAFRSGWSKFRSYQVPAGLLARGVNTIDIINYFNAELWVLSPIRLVDEKRGSRTYMLKNLVQVELIHAVYYVLLVFTLLFMAVYIRRKKEILYLYYAFSTFLLADMMLMQFCENLYPFIPLSSDNIYKIDAVGLMFFPPCLVFLFRSYMGLGVSRRRIILFLLLPASFALLMLLSFDRYYIIYWRNIFLLIIPLYIADIIVMTVQQIIAGNRKGLTLFMALLPIFVFGIYDVLVFSLHWFEGTVPLYSIGVPFMMIIIGVQLVNRFIYSLNTSEELIVLLNKKMEEGKRLARIENELQIARNIQLANVPQCLPDLKAFNIAVKYVPAENISGDFYNFHALEQDRLGVLIADVSGHGIPASLIASMLKILFNTLGSDCSEPCRFISGLNAYLYDKMEGNFLTAGYCYISMHEKKLLYSRAGHEPLLHISRRGDNAVLNEYLPRGRLIGYHSDMDVEQVAVSIDAGDRIILYTDGITEIFNGENEIFGLERLKVLLMQYRDLPVDESIELIYNILHEWNSGMPFDDDFTLIMIDVVKKG